MTPILNRLLLGGALSLGAALLFSGLPGAGLAQSAPTAPHHAPTGTSPHPATQLGAAVPPVQLAAPHVRADQTVSMSAPYTPSATLTDDYRCFLIDPQVTQDRFLEGFEVIPGNTGVVHHVIVNQVTPEQATQARTLDGRDGQPGWPCFGGTGLNGATSTRRPDTAQLLSAVPKLQAAGVDVPKLLTALKDAGGNPLRAVTLYGEAGGDTARLIAALTDSGLMGNAARDGAHGDAGDVIAQAIGDVFGVGSWVPGAEATVFPTGTGRKISRGNLLVMQVHYNTLAGREPDVTRMHLQYAPPGAQRTPLRGLSLVAPVEIPCPAGAGGDLCTRDASLAQNARQDGPRATRLVEGVLALCGQTRATYAKQRADAATSSCDRIVPQDAQAVGVTLHMHTLGTSGTVTLNPGTPREQVLLDIPEWNFHWQGFYWYEQPIVLRRGDVLRVTCTWDNTLSEQPKYVVWGEGTQDEMCLAGLTITGQP